MSFSTFYGNKIIDIARGTSYTSPSAIFAALHSSDPGLTGANECSGSGYQRVRLWLDAASNKATTSASVLTFSSMPSTNVTHASFWDWSDGGNVFMSGSFSASRVVQAGDTFQINAGDFDILIT